MNLRNLLWWSVLFTTLSLCISCQKETATETPIPSYNEGLTLRSNMENSYNFSIIEGKTEVFDEVDANGDYYIYSATPGAQTARDTVMSISWRCSSLETGTYDVWDLTIGTLDEDGLPVFVKSISMQVNLEHLGAVGERVIGTVSGDAQVQMVPLPPAPPSMIDIELEGEFNFLRTK